MDPRVITELGLDLGARRARRADASDRGPAGTTVRAAGGRSLDADLAERLHDGPLQDLAAMTLKLAVLQRTVPSEMRAEIAQLRELADSASGALRVLLGELAPEPLRSDLSAQLRELCTAFAAEAGIPCRDDLQEAHMRLDGAVSDLVYRAIRELLTNVRKHSGARSVLVSSAWGSDGDVVFSVADDGSGIPGGLTGERRALTGSGFGLWSIEHRVTSFGGRLEVECDGGLRVAIALPRQVVGNAI
jgi:two-component system, NarL family, sensor kinase